MSQPAPDASEPSPRVIALVDDDPMWRFLTSTALQGFGWTVEDHDSGQSLIDALPRSAADIILIDAMMPGMDGFQTCEAIRRTPAGARIPILMLTSLEDDDSIRAAYEAGATDFFIKSTHWVLLAERIRHLVRSGRIGRELDLTSDRLARVNTAAGVAAFDFDVVARVLRGSPGSFQVLGLGADRDQISQHELMELLEPQDRLPFLEAVADGVRRRRGIRAEFRLRTPGGELRHVLAEGEPELDVAGHVRLLRGVMRDQTDERRRLQEIERLATRDSLTGLPNRAEFLRRLGLAIEQAAASSTEVHVALFNLDRFTQFNETLGHAAGDELIVEAARRVESAVAQWLRAMGSGSLAADGGACVARLQGDEFAFMIGGLGGPHVVEALVQSVLREIGRACRVDGIDCFMTSSAGLAAYPRHAETPESLLSRADRANREVKARGRNDFAWYLPGLDRGGRHRIQMLSDLHKAVEREEFEVHYQPWVYAPEARVTGLEALVRWRRGGKLVAPGEFIPLAEESGLIIPIGEMVLRQAARALAGWRAQGIDLDCVAVNVPTQHFERDSLLASTREALSLAGLGPGAIELELTETCMVQDFERTLPRLEALIDAGAKLAIDDFGTGYSSLAYLTRLPISKLKVDRAFVNQLGGSRSGEAVCRAIVALGQSLQVQVLAEGVETADQVHALRRLGCQTMQGFLFSRPVPADQIPEAITRAGELAARLLAAEPAPGVTGAPGVRIGQTQS
jgi:diguanylate cyclase (GGDEF)-like protein